MLNTVLNTKLREKAGADSYNRFEYQTGWIVFHILEKLEDGANDFLILCEFHDDVAEASKCSTPDCLRFYQVKTKGNGQWSLADLTRVKKGKTGTKHSFLGYIFYNYLTFDAECEQCTFISNCSFDTDLRTWQSLVQDGKTLKVESRDIYNKLYDLLRVEYPPAEVSTDRFGQVFDIFCQNTHLTQAQIPLDNYEWVIKGKFLEVVAKRLDIKATAAHQALEEIWNTVRRKAKKLISTPISLTDLIAQKGVTPAVLDDLRKALVRPQKDEIESDLLKRFSSRPTKVRLLLREIGEHKRRRLDSNDGPYLGVLMRFGQVVDAFIDTHLDLLDDADGLDKLLGELIQQFAALVDLTTAQVTCVHLRGVFYEKLYARHQGHLV